MNTMKLGKKQIIGIAVLLAAAVLFFVLHSGSPKVQYRTSPVERGDLQVEVTATGTLAAHETVLVGTQVSGTVNKLFADFNSRVKKGQLIALLDTTTLYASLLEAQANTERARTQAQLAKTTLDRTKTLFDKGLAAQADLDQATADDQVAKASVGQMQAQLVRAKINLSYATICSPINGVVIARNVDVGQTVAASFNTPTLFTIADDLSKMQVQASVDEADIGMLKVGQKAQFTVDAYPSQSFEGTITQIRLSPTVAQNVVTYTVMINVDNADLHLMPGMTADLTVVVQESKNVLKVPLAALKFKPASATGGKRRWQQGGVGDSARAKWMAMRVSDSTPGRLGGPQGGGPEGKAFSMVFVLDNGKLRPVRVKTGLSNSGFTAIEGDLSPGDFVVTGVMSDATSKSASNMQPPNPLGGMGRRF
jgi:HlyD family secretion protein